MFALASFAVDEEDAVGLGEGPNPPSETAGQADQMGVVERVVMATMPGPPPHPETARGVANRQVGVEHQSVHTVIGPFQQILVLSGPVVFRAHAANLRESPVRALTAARRAPGS